MVDGVENTLHRGASRKGWFGHLTLRATKEAQGELRLRRELLAVVEVARAHRTERHR